MKTFIETERLLLRPLHADDLEAWYEMDSDPEVHIYLGNNPVTDKQHLHDVLGNLQQQYIDNGIGRWAVTDKNTHEFLGWAGLKLMKKPGENSPYYDLGYRLLRKHWGKGYATEAALAWVKYGFNEMNLPEICGRTNVGNSASKNVLQKAGLKYIDERTFDGAPDAWFTCSKEQWLHDQK